MIKSIKNEPTSSTNENSCDISYVMLGIFGLFLFKCSSYILQTPWNNIYQNVNKIERKKIIIPGPNSEQKYHAIYQTTGKLEHRIHFRGQILLWGVLTGALVARCHIMGHLTISFTCSISIYR